MVGSRGCRVILALWCVLSNVYGQVINSTDCGDGVTVMWVTWNMWSGLSACSATCNGENGEFSRQRTRVCPAEVMGCDAEQFEVQYYECEGSTPQEDGGYGHWSEWETTGACSVVCGTGYVEQKRTRQCDSPPPSCGGRDCRRLGPSVDFGTDTCRPGSCRQSCPRNSAHVVLRRKYGKGGVYLLCYRGSVYVRSCPSRYDFRAYFYYGYHNAITIFRVCFF